jgi:hypothetical protein
MKIVASTDNNDFGGWAADAQVSGVHKLLRAKRKKVELQVSSLPVAPLSQKVFQKALPHFVRNFSDTRVWTEESNHRLNLNFAQTHTRYRWNGISMRGCRGLPAGGRPPRLGAVPVLYDERLPVPSSS